MTATGDATDAWLGEALLAWHQVHGRKDLPWQQDPTPYRVWVSEVMLQQTQVATVIPYYQRFLERFPDIASLADATIDEVLHLWSGLGYYSRARNLHRCADIIVGKFAGVFPLQLEALQALPGIGRSTAAAILALAHNLPHAILDGNVKRVLCRVHGVAGWPGQTAVARLLWQLAERHTPQQHAAAYTQAIMDLGATLCTRSRPACQRCPLATRCEALRADAVVDYPTPRTRAPLPERETIMLILQNNHGDVLLERRPPSGIWGGLWSLPECPAHLDNDGELGAWCREGLGLAPSRIERWQPIRHTFTHFRLHIRPVRARVHPTPAIMEGAGRLWYNGDPDQARGMATPVRRLLNQINQH